MRPLLSLLALLTASLGAAQIGRKEVLTDTGMTVLHFFKSGGVSTKEWTDKDRHWGRSWAYAMDGRVLIDQQTRRIAGHASVHFTYHPNGTISKAEVSEAPDAGIQWYRSTTTFDENGQRTGFTEQGHDNDGMIPRLQVMPTPPPEEPAHQEVVVEQRLFVNEVFVVNPTKWTCKVHVLTEEPSPALPGGTFTIAPRDTLRVGSYSVGERFDKPDSHVAVFVSRKRKKGPWYMMAAYRFAEQQVSPELRRYYRIVDGWTSTKKFW